jgi:hypothetical protein
MSASRQARGKAGVKPPQLQAVNTTQSNLDGLALSRSSIVFSAPVPPGWNIRKRIPFFAPLIASSRAVRSTLLRVRVNQMAADESPALTFFGLLLSSTSLAG